VSGTVSDTAHSDTGQFPHLLLAGLDQRLV